MLPDASECDLVAAPLDDRPVHRHLLPRFAFALSLVCPETQNIPAQGVELTLVASEENTQVHQVLFGDGGEQDGSRRQPLSIGSTFILTVSFSHGSFEFWVSDSGCACPEAFAAP